MLRQPKAGSVLILAQATHPSVGFITINCGCSTLTPASMKRLFCFFGEDALMPDGMPFPKQIFDKLDSWRLMVELNTI